MASLTCPRCGIPVEPAQRFCEACGESLLLRRTPTGGPLGPSAACRSCGGTSFSADGFCESCGHGRPAGRDRMVYDLGLVAGVSDRGLRRSRNEDSMAFGAVGRVGGERLHDIIRAWQSKVMFDEFTMTSLFILREKISKSFENQVLAT